MPPLGPLQPSSREPSSLRCPFHNHETHPEVDFNAVPDSVILAHHFQHVPIAPGRHMPTRRTKAPFIHRGIRIVQPPIILQSQVLIAGIKGGGRYAVEVSFSVHRGRPGGQRPPFRLGQAGRNRVAIGIGVVGGSQTNIAPNGHHHM